MNIIDILVQLNWLVCNVVVQLTVVQRKTAVLMFTVRLEKGSSCQPMMLLSFINQRLLLATLARGWEAVMMSHVTTT